MTAALPAIVASLAPALDRYGYAAVIGLVGVEGFGIPAPGQTVIIAAAAYAAAGRLNLVLVLCCAFAAAVCGDNLGYAIGRFGGRRLLARFGHRLVPQRRLIEAQRRYARHGGAVVAGARFVDGLRQVNGIVAGSAGMPWWRFLACNAVGAAAWVGLWGTAGYLAGEHVETLSATFAGYQKWLLSIVAAAATILLARWLLCRRREPD